MVIRVGNRSYCIFAHRTVLSRLAMKNLFKILVLVAFVCLLSTANDVVAQCPMCKTSVESGLKEGNTTGLGLNDGILYLLAMPYVLVGGVGFIWYRNYRRRTAK